MKIILSSLLLIIISLPTLYAFMPAFIFDFRIGKIDKIEYNNGILKVNFDNFVHYEILDIFPIFEKRNYFIENMIKISDFPKDISLKKGDIVAIDSAWGSRSSGILKLSCDNGIMKIEGTKNKFFGTGLEDKHSDKEDNLEMNDDKILKKVNEVIGCNNLETFFDKDRRFEDLQGNNYFYIVVLFYSFISGIIIFSIFKMKSFLNKKKK